jgi:hypothetical protein
MRPLSAITAVVPLMLGLPTLGQTKVDLRTAEGVKLVKAEWRYRDAKIIEIDSTGPDKKPNKTYDIDPHAEKKDFDDSGWEVIDPTTLKDRRSTGRVCFCWYRIKVTLPSAAEGKSVHFVTTVDDYGEVWVDGALPRKPGDTGGPVVAGFNAPNRVELKDATPGKVYSIAVFGINGPISASPTNYIFLGPTYLELSEKK